jgi:tetratricopeptide (TPR) repeat protein
LFVAFLLLPLEAGQASFNWTELHQQTAVLFLNRRNREAQLALEESIASARRRGDSSAGFAGALNDLGTLYHEVGRLTDAERAYKESLSVWARIDGTHPKVAVTLGNLAGLRLVQGKLSDAEKLYLKAEPILIAGFGSRSQELATALCGLADVYSESGRYDKARETLERALAILDTGGDSSQLGGALFLLAKIAWKQNRAVDAELRVRRAIEVWQRTLGPRHPTVASGLATLAVVLSKTKPDEASRLFRESLELIETQLGPDHVFAGFILVDYAWHLNTLGAKKQAKTMKRRGENILAAHAHENGPSHTVDIKSFQRMISR